VDVVLRKILDCRTEVHSPVPANESTRLAFLRNLRLLPSDPFEEIQALCEVAATLSNCPIALVTLIEETQQKFQASVGAGDMKGTDREISFCAHAVMASKQLEVADALLDERFCVNPLVLGAPGIRSYLGTVLEPEPEMRIGTLCVIDTKPRAFSDELKVSLSQIGKAISALLMAHREKLRLIDYSTEIETLNTELSDLTTSLQKTTKKLMKAEKVKSEFLSIISHELRTPLTLIKGSLGLMKNDAVTTDKQKSQRLVDVAYDNNERLLSLVDDIFLVQKLDLDKAETRLGLVNLAEVIERAVAPFWSKAKNEEITLTFSESGTPCFVNGDEKQLERVFEKILSNAFKFSKRGGAIKVALLASDTGPEVRIEDEGVGISHGSQEKVFGLFSQMDSSDTRSQGGSGLGMYISKKVLKHHNATIHYESEPGVGTTFIVNFPKQILQ
jgi:signal transduction histidine kinase